MKQDSPAPHMIPKPHLINRAWQFFVNQLIQEVPADIAACEFDCRVADCSGERWISCERRLLAQKGIEGKKPPAA